MSKQRSTMSARLAAAKSADTSEVLSDIQGAAPGARSAPATSRSARPAGKGRRAGARGGRTTFTSSGRLYRATVYLAPATWERLKARGHREGKTAAELVRVAVERFAK